MSEKSLTPSVQPRNDSERIWNALRSLGWDPTEGNRDFADVQPIVDAMLKVIADVRAEEHMGHPQTRERLVEERLVVTDLCDMHAFHRDGRLGAVLRRAINFIEGQECFPSHPAEHPSSSEDAHGTVRDSAERLLARLFRQGRIENHGHRMSHQAGKESGCDECRDVNRLIAALAYTPEPATANGMVPDPAALLAEVQVLRATVTRWEKKFNDRRRADLIAKIERRRIEIQGEKRAQWEELKEQRDTLAKWICHEDDARVDSVGRSRIDHACEQCIPGGPIVTAGFECAVHLARRIEEHQFEQPSPHPKTNDGGADK